MSTYRVGSDHSGKGDEDCIKNVCAKLEEAGHETVNLGVTPNLEGQLGAGSKDDIGVFLVNGICIGTIQSCHQDLIEGGKCSHVYFGIPKPLMSAPFNNRESLTDKNKKVAITEDGTPWTEKARSMDGKYTVAELFEQFDGVDYAYGDTCEEVAEAILNGNDSSGTTQSTGEGSIMSGWESITDLLKPLDGEAQVLVRGDVVEIKRIEVPVSSKLWVFEGVNVVDDSVTVHDYTPEIYNTFIVKWGETFQNELEVSFDRHVELYGERKTEVNATYEMPEDEVPDDTTEDSEDDKDKKDEKNDSDDRGWLNSITSFLGLNAAEESKKLAEENASTTDDTKYTEVPITTLKDAYLFGLKVMGMAMRKDGHKIECKVIGDEKWQMGEWCHVCIPTFDEECVMFINKCSHEMSSDNEWITSLTLVDYPPSLGHGHSNTNSQNDDSTDDSSSDDTESSGNENNDEKTDSSDSEQSENE